MNPIPFSALNNYPRLRRFVIDVGVTAIFNIICAVVVTYVMRIHDSFLTNFVISMCIGLLAVTLIDGGRLLLWGQGRPPALPFCLLLAVAIPVAQQAGNLIAAQILGIPLESLAAVRARNATSILVMTVLACLFMTWIFWNRQRLEQWKTQAEIEKTRAAAIEKQALQAQLQLLQAQIEPHMLFNTLANLRGLISLDAARAQQLLDQLIHYLRATLSSSRAEKTTLLQEFSLIDAYLSLMAIRMGPRLSYAVRIPEALHDIPLPPMLLQPLVENAIKHGLEPNIDGGHIDVQARQEAGMLWLTVTDTGMGLDTPSCDTAGPHVGLANICERLHALYGERASCSLTAHRPAGTAAQLIIPL